MNGTIGMQIYVFTVIHRETHSCLGTYQTFMQAYDRIADCTEGSMVLDVTDARGKESTFTTKVYTPLSDLTSHYDIHTALLSTRSDIPEVTIKDVYGFTEEPKANNLLY